jgi:hypothetical protein
MTETAAVAAMSGPADGSLYGWHNGTTITALVMFFDDGAPDGRPSWSVCPRAGVPEAHWPPFTPADWGPDWFREHYRAGHLADLAPAVAATRNMIFAIPSGEALGNFLFAVKADITLPGGLVLPRGMYAHCSVLRAGCPLPSLADLLADPARMDLGPRFPLP